MFSPQHCGLTFTEAHIEQARARHTKAPFNAAWHFLASQVAVDADIATLLLTQALRWRLSDDTEDGERAVQSLLRQRDALSTNIPVLRQSQTLFALAQAYELTRDHPAWTTETRKRWLAFFLDAMQLLSRRGQSDAPIVDTLWIAMMQTAAGVVLESVDWFDRGVNTLQRVIEEEIHPEGYLRLAVEIGPEAQSLRNQVLCAQALVLNAEIAAHSGRDLWSYEVRGVSVTTATTYPLYYYFYPEKWRWNGQEWKPSEGVEEDVAKQIFQENAGFLEIVNGRYDKPLRAIKLILDDLRPVFDPFGGGLVTLTHGLLERRGLFG